MVLQISSIDKNTLFMKFKFLLYVTMFVFLICLFFCHLDENVVAEGMIRPLHKEESIETHFSGIVTEIYYSNSQYVHEGDILFIQDCTLEEKTMQNLMSLQSLYEKSFTSYKNLQVLLVDTDIENFCFDESLQKDDYVYSSFINQYKRYKNDTDSKQKSLERQLVLYPNVISKQELENYENEFLQSKLIFSTWIENQKIIALEQYTQYFQKYEECRLQILKMQKLIENAVIKANQSGFINEVKKINIGEYVTAESQILTIIPANSELKCVIKVSNSNISKIKIGQDVFIQIEDLPFIKYGKLEGSIIMIPSDAVLSDSPFYPVEVHLTKNYMKSKNQFGLTETVMLRIGTKVSAKIIVDRYSVFQRVLQKMVIYDE